MKNKPTVLFISYTRVVGGGEIYLSLLLPKIKDRFTSIVLAKPQLKDLVRDSASFQPFLLPPKWLERLPRNYRLRKLYYHLYFRLACRLDKYNLVSLQAFDGALIEALNKRPLMLTLHTRFLIPREFDDGIRHSFERIDKVICVSQQTKKDLTDRGIDEDKCVVIHNAVDPTKYKANKEPGEFITWIGRVEEADKNPLLFMRIAKVAQAGGAYYKFRVVGEGSYLPELKKYMRENDLKNVEFYGFCQPDKMSDIYKQASVLCMTSTSEGLSYVALEAMASGVPVVATRVGGLPEIINQPAIGTLVSSFNEAELFSAIDSLLKDTKKYESMQAAARKRIETDFSLDVMIEKTAVVYESLLG
jgi:glycosyltransferase involved in cell wall biosynthesis